MPIDSDRIRRAIDILTLETGQDGYKVEVVENHIFLERDNLLTKARIEPGDDFDALVLKLDAEWIPESASGLEGFFPRMNKFAGLSALTNDRTGPFVGAKIILQDGFDADHPDIRMMASAFATQSDAFKIDDAKNTRLEVLPSSTWTQDDLAATHRALDGSGTLGKNIVSLQLPELDEIGAPKIQFRNDMAHPRLGGGLYCLLTMPYQIGSTAMRDQAAKYLNSNALDNPHHSPNLLGAWCAGHSDSELCFTCFLPNKLYGVRNVIKAVLLNMEAWATIAHLDLMND